jgi:serine kinase of HPr protein (carbohydrate metabolism regulator)
MVRVRGTCICIDGHAVLLRGPSGSGKSDLALRLIDSGGALVADDYTDVEQSSDGLVAMAPAPIRGLLEVRGLGVIKLGACSSAPLVAAIDLVPLSDVDRMPEPQWVRILNARLPCFQLFAFESSAAAKVRLAVRLATGGIILTK